MEDTLEDGQGAKFSVGTFLFMRKHKFMLINFRVYIFCMLIYCRFAFILGLLRYNVHATHITMSNVQFNEF